MKKFIGWPCFIKYLGEDCDDSDIPEIINGVVNNGIYVSHNGVIVVNN